MMHSWPELLHKSRSPGSWCQISGRLSYLGGEDIAMCIGRTLIDLVFDWTAEWHILHSRFAAYGVHETTGRNTCLFGGDV